MVTNAPLAAAPPKPPRLFLIDGYALIYRAFFALISRPLTTSHGENTSAAWGIVNFLSRLVVTHKPEYLGWVHDSGLSFRHEAYPAYKATREKLSEELQSDFDRGLERIGQVLDAHHIKVITLKGYEADDVIGTLALQGEQAGMNVVIVSGDKDFHQLVRPRVWLLNPGRGGPASVEESWVGMENASQRLGVPPDYVTDYLAMVGDSSDNIPGVKGIGDKTACELVARFGHLEAILEAAPTIEKKRPREALLEHAALARLSKELVTIRDDLNVSLDLDALRLQQPDYLRLRDLYLELEFHTLAKNMGRDAVAATAPAISPAPTAPADDDSEFDEEALSFPGPPATEQPATQYVVVDTVESLARVIARARQAPWVAIATEGVVDPQSPSPVDALRSTLVSVAIAVSPGEAYYLPLRHRAYAATAAPAQGDLLVDLAGDRSPTDAPGDRGLVAGGDDVAMAMDFDGRPKKTKTPKEKAPASIAGKLLATSSAMVPTNLPPLDSAVMAPLRELLEDASVKKTAQNAKFDVLALRRAGITLRGIDFDTMLASYVLDPGRRSHGLDVLAMEFLDHTMTSYDDLCGKGKGAIPFDMVPITAARDFSCEDADMAFRLREVFEPQLEQQDLVPLLNNVEVPLVDVLAEMEWTGIAIDLPWFASLKERFAKARAAVELQVYAAAGREFNIGSNPQLRTILFEELKLPVLKKTATGPSTDASVLQQLADDGHTLPVLLMEYRELSKLESTYIDALPALVHPADQRLHTTYSQAVASTGRLSSNDPNLQNIPIRRELGQEIRRGFIPRKGWKLVSADYSQIELRLLAHLSGDPAFVEAFNAGGDIHKQTASIIFDVPVADVTKEMRARAKTINFATIYGQGAHALSQQLKIEFAEAKQFIQLYFERFSGIRAYLDSQVELARKHGFVQTIFGRRRYIPELRDRNFNIRAFGERTAANSPIQGSAADLIKMAMIRIHRALIDHKLESRMLLQVHDELVFEVPAAELDRLTGVVRQEMEHAAELSVPLVVDIGWGNNWLETKEGS